MTDVPCDDCSCGIPSEGAGPWCPVPEAEVPEVEVVPLDEASMEDYPCVDTFVEADEFGAPPVKPVKIIEGVQDTAAHGGRKA